jgi:acyl carrier protein
MISTLYEVPKDTKHEYPSIAIGRPIGNVRIYILDRFGHPVPARVKGEIYIGGIGVGHGYLNYPDLTIERFLPDPFHSGGMMYRTGDMASYSCDGILSFWGRLDQQVKVRGYRVELGEIESVVKEFLGIKDVAVVLWNQYGLDTLAAYITISEGYHEPILEHLHVYLADRLPFYMLPSIITVMEKMPLTPNRKIDRLALPRPERVEEPEHYLAPRNDVETRLISIWEEVLGITKIGVRDNFFELGGHSLMAMRLFSRIQDEFGKSLPLILLFKNGTVEVLAESLTQDANSPIRRESTQPTSSRADLAKSKKDRGATHD